MFFLLFYNAVMLTFDHTGSCEPMICILAVCFYLELLRTVISNCVFIPVCAFYTAFHLHMYEVANTLFFLHRECSVQWCRWRVYADISL